MDDLKIKNGSIVTPQGIVKGGFTVKEGRITALGADASLPPAAREADAHGHVVLPGLIDPHLHLGLGAELGKGDLNFAATMKTESATAAVGGVTTIMSTALFAGAGRGSNIPCMARAKEMGAENSLVDFRFTAFMMNETHIQEIPKLVEMGVCSFKFLMAYKGEEGKQVGALGIDWGFALRGFEVISQVSPPAVALVHAEAAEVLDTLKARLMARGRDDLAAWTESRPAVAEAMDVANAGLLALEKGVPVYFPHISSRQGLQAAGFVRDMGARVYVETCPHYLVLTKDSPLGNYGKVNPPLRDQDDQEALWQAIQAGAVDSMGTDHAAYKRRHKEGTIWQCMPGFGGLGATLPLLITHGVKKGRLTWERLARITSENTARIFGMYPKKGALAVGSDADFVIVDPDQEWVLGPDTLCSSSDFSVYEGMKVTGRPVATYVRGVKVAEAGASVREAPFGQYVPIVPGR